MLISPCRDCPDRRSLCHGECARYKAFRERFDEEKSETKTVAPDGSTVVNVYFDCQTRNISFTFPDRDGNNVTVSAQVKYSADMGFFWDEVASYNDLDYLLDGKHEFLLQPNAVSVDSLSDMKKMIFYADEAGTWRAVNFNLADRTFYETLEGVAPDGKEAVPNTSARILGGYNTDDRLYYEVSRGYVFGGAAKGVVPGDPTPEPPSDPTPTPGPKDKPGTHGSKTGDETRLLTWSVTFLLAGTGLMMSILRLRRKRKHKS